MSKRIFISYRRADAQMAAGRLYGDLVDRFGSQGVFRDKEGIRPGYDWSDEIQRVLHEDVVVLALIGPSWIGATDAEGRRRLEDPNDANRIELETALGKSLPTIPVLVEGAVVPEASDLPPSLASLVRRHAIRLRDDDWDADFARIAAAIEGLGLSAAPPAPAPPPTATASSRGRLVWVAAAAVVILALGGFVAWTTLDPEPAETPASVATAPTTVPIGDATLESSTRQPDPPPQQRPAAANTPPVAPPRTASPGERLVGAWDVVQNNTDGTSHAGVLALSLDGDALRGTLAWEGLKPSDLSDVTVTRDRFAFTARYPDGSAGRYTASIADSGRTLTNGETTATEAPTDAVTLAREGIAVTAKYPDGRAGRFAASIADSARALTKGDTAAEGNAAKATWRGSKRAAPTAQ